MIISIILIFLLLSITSYLIIILSLRKINLLFKSYQINKKYKNYFYYNKTITKKEIEDIIYDLKTNYNNKELYEILNNLYKCNYNLFNNMISDFIKGKNINIDYLSKLNHLFKYTDYYNEMVFNNSQLKQNHQYKKLERDYYNLNNDEIINNDFLPLFNACEGINDLINFFKNDDLKYLKQFILNIINNQFGFITKEFNYINNIINLLNIDNYLIKTPTKRKLLKENN